MSTVTTLRDARDLLLPPERWTKGYFARDAHGNQVDTLDPTATCFCSLGAIARVKHDSDGYEPAVVALRKAILSKGYAEGVGVAMFNDNTTHGKVLDAFDAAIAAEIAKETAGA